MPKLGSLLLKNVIDVSAVVALSYVKEPTNSSEIMTARLLPRLSSERVTRIFSQPYSTIILILHLSCKYFVNMILSPKPPDTCCGLSPLSTVLQVPCWRESRNVKVTPDYFIIPTCLVLCVESVRVWVMEPGRGDYSSVSGKDPFCLESESHSKVSMVKWR